jgi:hypothetical protein
VHDDKSAETLWDAKDTCRNLAGIGKIWQYPVWLEVLGFAQRALVGEHRAAEVEHAPVANRVIDHVPVGPGPEHRVGVLQVLWHLGGWDGGAEDDRASRQRIAIADNVLTHVRIHAIGADQCRSGDALTGL